MLTQREGKDTGCPQVVDDSLDAERAAGVLSGVVGLLTARRARTDAAYTRRRR